jgi:hypothetical protein
VAFSPHGAVVYALQQDMGQGGEKFMGLGGWRLLALAAIAMALFVPAAAAVPPGVDEYTLDLPGAGGDHHVDGGPTAARPGLLPGGVQAKLASSGDGALLTELATSRALGAPGGHAQSGSGSGEGGALSASAVTGAADEGSSLPGVIINAITSSDGLPLLAFVLVAAAAGTLLALRRRRPGSRGDHGA